MTRPFHADGLRFECTGCGHCCQARGKYAYVYVVKEDRRRLARHLGLSTAAFTRKYCETTDGHVHLRNPSEDCEFLDGARCTVYEARPGQCRTWPFWPENMSARQWNGPLRKECEGIGRGRLHPRGEIEVHLTDERRRDRGG